MAQPPSVPINGATLRLVRERHGITAEQLAEDIGADKSTISRYERGIVFPGRENLGRICKRLAIPEEALDCTSLIRRIVSRAIDMSPEEESA